MFFFQGPLEKSLQSSSVSERQRNVEHKVAAIKNSVQVSGLTQMHWVTGLSYIVV